MALTASKDIKIGTEAPEFSLPDTRSKQRIQLSGIYSETATVIMFICNHCPFVKHIIKEVVTLAKDYQPLGVNFVAISSNDIDQQPEDHPDKMEAFAEEHGFTFPYLYDETQDVARAYNAACTPDFYIYDGNLKLAYHGQLDNSRPENGVPVTGKHMRQALYDVIAKKQVSIEQQPSMGCNIKWKKK